MAFEWWNGRRRERDRREREREALEAEVRERAFAVVRAIAEPLVAEDAAELDWLDADPDTGARPRVAMQPRRGGAVTVEVCPGAFWVVLQFARFTGVVGPDGLEQDWGATEELHSDRDGPDPDWDDQLRRILEAVVDGGFSELIEPERHGYLRTLTFRPRSGETLVRRSGYGGVEPGERRETSFTGYR
jgi:hypothetical protein